jgi:hypothetical protein
MAYKKLRLLHSYDYDPTRREDDLVMEEHTATFANNTVSVKTDIDFLLGVIPIHPHTQVIGLYVTNPASVPLAVTSNTVAIHCDQASGTFSFFLIGKQIAIDA